MSLSRGMVIRSDILGVNEPKLFVIVSANQRNRALPTVLAVRLTTTVKPDIPSIVEIPAGEPVTGRVLCDDIVLIYDDEVIGQPLGALSPRAMAAVGEGLKAALALN